MAKLKDKIQNALDESRMLVLGSQVLLGFEYRSVFESGFEKLPVLSQDLKVTSLGLMLLALALLMSTATYHQLVANGEDQRKVHEFATRVMFVALLPFALGLGLDLYVATEKLTGSAVAGIAGAVAALVAIFFWYGLEAIHRMQGVDGKERKQMDDKEERDGGEGTNLQTKIKQVLTEARVVLPGAQALLGFQFASMLVEGFDKLPEELKYVHLVSLGVIALTTVLLMAPAAYHRIVEQGEDTEHFHRLASRLVVAAMAFLALGVTGDFFVVISKVSKSYTLALVISGLMLLFIYALWFGFTLFRRNQQQPARQYATEGPMPQSTR